MPRSIGIDYGLKRIGIAISDPDGIVATPHSVIQRDNLRAAIEQIATLCREYEPGVIVVGWPLNMDGSEGPAAEAVGAFISALVKHIDIPIRKWDERLSTRTAEQVLIQGGARRKRRKQVVDKLAAQIILQHYLDAQITPME